MRCYKEHDVSPGETKKINTERLNYQQPREKFENITPTVSCPVAMWLGGVVLAECV
jgi:hypothetical protein